MRRLLVSVAIAGVLGWVAAVAGPQHSDAAPATTPSLAHAPLVANAAATP